ncbi:DASH family cryptochrome [Oceanobacter kriegii]|uniref:DASH family cryptochrome n=1 Tax=Oceanobacter kriegii TaxID=64972 RepID=UPI00040B0905|nr:DASH family cryptochrome [Oceanobacter kriegii]
MQLLWLRNDLRLHDHPGFELARQRQQPLAVVYILPSHWLQTDSHGTHRLSAVKARFLRTCLIQLHRDLYKENIRLTLTSGDPVEVLTQLHQQHPFELLTHTAQAPEEADWLAQLQPHMTITTYESQTLFSEEQLAPLLNQNSFPASFSGFRKQVERKLDIQPPEPIAPSPLLLTDWTPDVPGNIQWPDDWHLQPQPGFNRLGGEQPGIKWLKEYLWQRRAIDHYKSTRNRLTGDDYSSQISPWLAWGSLSPRYVWQQINDYESEFGSSEHSGWLKQELLWREFFHWSLRVNQHRFFTYSGLKAGELTSPPAFNQSNWDAWRNASTGFPMIDAGLNELHQSGFVSNRLRQILASFFIHELQLDWRLGARWFEQHLIDFDVASNWGNWSYIAGSGHDPRNGRYFMLNKQLRQYDPELSHIHLWLPELKDSTLEHICQHQQGQQRLKEYPAPIVTVKHKELFKDQSKNLSQKLSKAR